MSDELVVHHFGPDPASVGGMATVIRVFTEHRVGGDVVDFYPTWRPQSSLGSIRLCMAAARAIRRMPASDIAHIHLSEKGSFVREGFLVGLARRRGLLTAVTMHGASFLPFAEKHPRLAVAVLRRAHLVMCLDQETLDFVQLNAPEVLSTIVPNPIFVDDSFLPADATEELVVFAGEIGLRKGADVLCQAWPLIAERRPHARLLMVGPVSDFAPGDAERLEVLLPVDASEMRAIMQDARVVALPSREEKMPMALTEAMSLARPFVSTPVGGIPELAHAGGRLVAVGDEIGLADVLTELLANPDRARAIGESGRRFSLETRSVDTIDARVRELYALARVDR